MDESGTTGSVITDLIRDALERMPRGTAQRLADRLNMSPQAVSSWKHGHTTPEPELWADIEDELNIPLGAFHASRFSPSANPYAAYEERLQEAERRIRELEAKLAQGIGGEGQGGS